MSGWWCEGHGERVVVSRRSDYVVIGLYYLILAVFCSDEGFAPLFSITAPLPPAPHHHDGSIAHVHGYQKCALLCSNEFILEYNEQHDDGRGKETDVPQEGGPFDPEWLDDTHAACHDAYYKGGGSKQFSNGKTP